MTTLLDVELGVLGPLQVRRDGAPVTIPGAKPRAILTMLGLHGGSVVSADTLVELLWGDDPPRTAAKALQTHISLLRRILGDGFVLTEGAGWTLAGAEVDASRYKAAARMGRDAAAAGDTGQAVARFEEALALWRGIPELPDGRRGTSEKTRWIEGHAALVEDRADALLATGRAAEIVGELESAVADAPLRERRWGQLMLALYRAGRQGEALGAYQRARALLADELGVDPGPHLRRLEAAIVAQDAALETPVAQNLPAVSRAVTFLLTDIEGSTAAWETDADAMAAALARHDELVEQVVTSRGGRLIKTRGEGDATFSVFERPSAAAAAAIELQDAISHEPWALREPMRIRVALHTGEVELRDGDYFGRAVNRAARLRSLAEGGQILCSGATAELVIDSLPDDVVLADLGMRELRNLARPEHVFELRLETADDHREAVPTDEPMQRPSLPAVLAGPGPFVGRGRELERLFSAWQTALAGATNAVLIAGEPGVGKTRLAGEWSRQAYDEGALVIYGRCDEDLGAPYQPFAEALRSLVPCLGASKLRGLRGVEALLPLVPGLTDVLPDLAPPTRADPDTERYALFDAVVGLLGVASTSAPVVLILDDLHWAAKPTLLLLRHLLRFGEQARVQVIGTYRSTDLDRSHPLAAMLADLHRDGTANRIQLSGLDEDDVTAYVAGAGYNDEELARALASVTGGNPFFLIEALRHVDESGGRWDQSTLPQGVREAVSRRLSRLAPETNKALATAAVVGSRFALELVERVVGDDLVDAFDEACKAGLVIEEPGGHYRFNHAIVRQSLLAELASVRRMRLHQRIAATLENEPGADDELLAELAHHYFECAWAGNAAKAVEYCRRAADQAMARLAYEGAADLYDHALHALEELDDELPDRDEQVAGLLIARCEALLAAGDVASAAGAVSQFQHATLGSARLAAWATSFDGQLSMLIHPERLDEVEAAVGAAAETLAGLDDAAGEAKAHTVRAGCLARLGRIGDCEIALDDALTAARRAREHRRVNAVLANAPLAALWGPNPVPRAGGRCLDVVRLLRITTDSPAVEATSTRCQAVLEAFRGRAEAARRMIDSARRTVTELGLRHALLEVEQFAGIVELVVDDPAAAEPHLRKAYNGFRRMGLDADTAETAALLGRTCLSLDRDAEADELCSESERLAGHALKASIAWRTLRARLLSRGNDHAAARRVAEAAVSLAERTDALVDHGDACLTLATVLGAAGDAAGARAAAERAAGLYERKGAAALAEKANRIVGTADLRQPPQPQAAPVALTNACVQAGSRLIDAVNREAWDEVKELLAPYVSVESRRKIVGFPRIDLPSSQWPQDMRQYLETGMVRFRHTALAVRGERLALTRLEIGTTDLSSGAPRDEMLHVAGIDEEGRIALQVWFDVEDIDAALAELDAAHARFEEVHPRAPLQNAATRVDDQAFALFADRRCDEIGALYADDIRVEDRRQGLHRESNDRATAVNNVRAIAALGANITNTPRALRGDRLCLSHVRFEERDPRPDAFGVETLEITEVDTDGVMIARVVFDPDDLDAAIAELDARYLAGEAAPYAATWLAIAGTYASVSRNEIPALTPDCVSIDHRRVAAFADGDLIAYFRAGLDQDISTYIEAVHKLNSLGAVVTHVAYGTSHEGFDAEWHEIAVATVQGDRVNRCELFDETDVDAAIARFDQLSRLALGLENAASQITERLQAHFEARDWTTVAEMLADDVFSDDRRRVVNAGIRRGRDAAIRDARANSDLGVRDITSTVVATRGERLVLRRSRYSGDAFHTDLLSVFEVGDDDRVVARVVFDPDDFDAAIAELDARYIAGEAAAYSRTWSVVAGAYVAHNRREVAATTPDVVSIDHRRVARFAPGEGIEYIRAGWDLDQDLNIYIEAVHRASALGTVFTWAGHGTSQEGFAAEWRGANLFTVEGDLINRVELFDEADIDVALARFEHLNQPVPRLENAASRADERFIACFEARDWDAIATLMADDISIDDRRHVVNAGLRCGREVEIANLRARADTGIATVTSAVIATRGDRLALSRNRFWGQDQRPDAFHTEALCVIEIDTDERIVARVGFDLDDFEAAVAELDARYLAGEAAPYSRTWSVVTRGFAALNRRELPPTTPDWVNIDHRRGTSIAPGEMPALLSAAWNLAPDLSSFIQTVHRLNNLGAVVTHMTHETSQEGFHAEWRVISLLTLDGDSVNRCEVFDEADVDAAIERFDQLSRPAPRLENAASQVAERFRAHIAAQDWAAIMEALANDFSIDDRRRVVNAGIRHGRDAEIEDLRAAVEVGMTNVTSVGIATRGGRLALARTRYSGQDERPDAFQNDVLNIVEIDAHERIAAVVVFDLDDFDAAFEELDVRYLAGEAAPYAHTWSVIAAGYAALNRHELPPTTPDCVSIDHRRGAAFATSDLTAIVGAHLELSQDISVHVEAVHRLRNFGAVVTNMSYETSLEGFDAEWRMIQVLTVEGDRINRAELFDEAELDVALARFEELNPQAPWLENAASQLTERCWTLLAAGDWDAMAEILAADYYSDDRRRLVNAGIRHGRDAEIENLRAAADVGLTDGTSTVVATRGKRLALSRLHSSDRDQRPEPFGMELLGVIEINANNRIAAVVVFDLDDIDGAFEELDARYLASEAAPYAHTWSVIAGVYAAFNRRELPAADWVTIDHRRGTPFASGDLTAFIRTSLDLTPDLSMHIEAVHRLSNFGAVLTNTSYGTSQEGFDAEWRMIQVLTVEGDRINRLELFDEADLDAALARFEGLRPQAARLENAASQLAERLPAHFAARDWAAMTELLADDISTDDRRRVVNAGNQHGRDVYIATLRALADLGVAHIALTVIATRGERLALSRARMAGRDQRPDAFRTEALSILEIDADNRGAAVVVFDLDDIDAAFEELDARYLAGEAAAHSHTWSVIAGAYAAINRYELPPTTAEWVNIDHRPLQGIETSDLTAYIRATWDVKLHSRVYIEAVHCLSDAGAVVTYAAHGTSQEGFNAEWRAINISMVDGDLIDRSELFDDTDLDAAIAKFEELRSRTLRLETAASQGADRFVAHFAARDWDALAELFADDYYCDDRRRVVNAGVRRGRAAAMEDLRVAADVGLLTNINSTAIATRGERLILTRFRASGRETAAVQVDVLQVVEYADERIAAVVVFDIDDIDAAIAELDARYLTGEAAADSHTWSVIARAFAAINRHELPERTPDWVNIDHRRGAAFATGDMTAYIHDLFDDAPDINVYIEAVHRLSNHGAVVTQKAHGTSQQGFEAEWREIGIFTFDGDLLSRYELFDEADLDPALARFEELHPQTPRLENAATLVTERFLAHFAAGDWDAMPEMMADNFSSDDRRRVVGAGVRHGRNAQIMDMRTIADLGITNWATTHIATRGGRLALSRTRMSGRDQGPEAFYGEMLDVVEINADAQIVAYVLFDLDDINAAFEELDARYLAGEAAAHAHTWSVITRAYAAINRHELPATTPDWVNIDHRRGIAFAPGDATAYLRASQDPQGSVYVETVHRLSNLGAVFTWAGHGTSQEGFEAEWRGINVLTVEGDLINRGEIFDEADIDAAIVRFEELHPQARRLENAASHVAEHFLAYFTAGDWDAMAEILADNFSQDDRRRVVGAGVRHGRDAQIADMRAIANLGTRYLTSSVLATRGERLVLVHHRLSFRDQGPEGFLTDVLVIGEINADGQIVAAVSFDLDDTDAAFEELDAHYLAGEAAPYARVWQLGMNTIAELNRHERGPMIGRFVYADHRRIPFASGEEFGRGVEELWALVPDARYWTKAVHALDSHGSVATLVIEGTDAHGSELQWGRIILFGSEEPRVEVYEEEDVDAALARFEELRPQSRRFENAASQVVERFWKYFGAREWAAMAELVAHDIATDDRRRVVNAGIRRGRDDHMADMRAIAEVLPDEDITSTVMATRGARLALTRICGSNRGLGAGEVSAEILSIDEIDADNRIVARVGFDLDDIDAAFEELDGRYLAGEAAAHAHTWSVIARECAAFNRHELPAADWVTIDHRQLAPIDASDLPAAMRAVWDLTPDLSTHIEAVHRLSSFGAIVTYTANGTSPEGFDAEWRMIELLIVDGDRMNRCEIFDEADLDAALARFDELRPQTRRLENAASRLTERFLSHFAARSWDAIAEMMADDSCIDDRRRVVNAGFWDGRDVVIANMRALDEGGANIAWTVIATRGERLSLTRICSSNRDPRQGEFGVEMLGVAEIDSDERFTAHVLFDPDNIDAAFAELDARYLAGEAAAHSHTWSAIAEAYAGFNRHQVPATTPDWVYIDHRPVVSIEARDMAASVRAVWDITPEVSIYMEAVHRLSDLGAIVTARLYGTSPEGFDAEWRMIDIFTVEGDRLSRCEMFDEADLDAALARFEQLHPQARRLENAASRLYERLRDCFVARDRDAIIETLADDISTDDRRRVVGAGVQHGRDAMIAEISALAAIGVENATAGVIATRGERVVLSRARSSGRDPRPEAFHVEVLDVVEIGAEGRVTARVVFDPDDIDAAFDELDARYLAGEAAAHAHTWSVIAGVYAAFNRHEFPATTPDWVNVDHRQLVAIEADGVAATMRALWDQMPDISIHMEEVHRLSDLGAVVTHAAHGSTRDGFDAEWRSINIYTVEGDSISRCEMFDETDLDAALARFDELDRPPLLENSATRIWARLVAAFNRRDVASLLAFTSADGRYEHRRKGLRDVLEGPARRKAVHAMFDTAPSGWRMEVEPIAIRGSRLSLTRERYRDVDDPDRPIVVELLRVMELGDDDLTHDTVSFDPDDIDAAFEELDARYLAGEAAAHPHTWPVVARAYGAANRHELPPTTPDWVNIDHRRGRAFAPGDLEAYLRATWDLTEDIKIYIEAVHRLSDLGAVVTHTAYGTSRQGFDAEWREVNLLTAEGDMINRCEVFDEADIDSALARFDELDHRSPLLENAATRTFARVADAFNRRDVAGLLALSSVDGRYEDRRKGLRDVLEGPARRKAVHTMFETFPSSWRMEVEPIAIRGPRLSLIHEKYRDTADADRPTLVELLRVIEVGNDGLMHDTVSFDPDDLNDAFAELTDRWIASGEVAHPDVVEEIRRLNEIINRHDWDAFATRIAGATYVNHRQLDPPGAQNIADHMSSIRMLASLVPDYRVELAEVLALSATGLVDYEVLRGTSTDGVAIEIPLVVLILLDGGRLTRLEVFDADQRGSALARFEELNRSG